MDGGKKKNTIKGESEQQGMSKKIYFEGGEKAGKRCVFCVNNLVGGTRGKSSRGGWSSHGVKRSAEKAGGANVGN